MFTVHGMSTHRNTDEPRRGAAGPEREQDERRGMGAPGAEEAPASRAGGEIPQPDSEEAPELLGERSDYPLSPPDPAPDASDRG